MVTKLQTSSRKKAHRASVTESPMSRENRTLALTQHNLAVTVRAHSNLVFRGSSKVHLDR